MEQKDSILS